jgi:lysozyme family protein
MKRKKKSIFKKSDKVKMEKVDMNDPRIQERIKYVDEMYEQAEKRKKVPWWAWFQQITK